MKAFILITIQVALGIQRTFAECPEALPGLTKWTEMSTVVLLWLFLFTVTYLSCYLFLETACF